MINTKRTKGKIKKHYGTKDYYNFFKTTYPLLKINKSIYNKIIDDFNKQLVNLIIEENLDFKIPHLGSNLGIRKVKNEPRIKDGKLINNTPINWVETKKLWDEDPECKEKKLLVRFLNNHTSKFVFRLYFKKYVYPFKNKQYFKFKTVRSFSRLLAKRIKDETKQKYDAYLLY